MTTTGTHSNYQKAVSATSAIWELMMRSDAREVFGDEGYALLSQAREHAVQEERRRFEVWMAEIDAKVARFQEIARSR